MTKIKNILKLMESVESDGFSGHINVSYDIPFIFQINDEEAFIKREIKKHIMREIRVEEDHYDRTKPHFLVLGLGDNAYIHSDAINNYNFVYNDGNTTTNITEMTIYELLRKNPKNDWFSDFILHMSENYFDSIEDIWDNYRKHRQPSKVLSSSKVIDLISAVGYGLNGVFDLFDEHYSSLDDFMYGMEEWGLNVESFESAIERFFETISVSDIDEHSFGGLNFDSGQYIPTKSEIEDIIDGIDHTSVKYDKHVQGIVLEHSFNDIDLLIRHFHVILRLIANNRSNEQVEKLLPHDQYLMSVSFESNKKPNINKIIIANLIRHNRIDVLSQRIAELVQGSENVDETISDILHKIDTQEIVIDENMYRSLSKDFDTPTFHFEGDLQEQAERIENELYDAYHSLSVISSEKFEKEYKKAIMKAAMSVR